MTLIVWVTFVFGFGYNELVIKISVSAMHGQVEIFLVIRLGKPGF